jgi:hypothetical protein
MSFADGNHDPKDIARMVREIDYTGDFRMSADQIEALIEFYGNVRYAQGVAGGLYPKTWQEDH